MIQYFPSNWLPLVGMEFEKSYFKALVTEVESAYQEFPNQIFPLPDQVFKAFQLCSPENLKVIIVGQDPYYTKGFAHGLAFSVATSARRPPRSLLNIFKERASDLELKDAPNVNLESWAKQGVLLLNAVLTVRENLPNSHASMGWETFTDAVMNSINCQAKHVVFLLWGTHAKKKLNLINQENHLVLCAAHPSPLSANRGFFGCRHFSKANDYLMENGRSPIAW